MPSAEWLQLQADTVATLKSASGVVEDALSRLQEHAELAEGRVRDQQAIIDALRKSNESLEEENRRLRKELLANSAPKDQTTSPNPTVEYEEFKRVINDLKETNINFRTSNELAVKRLKEAKRLVASWRKYFEKRHRGCCGTAVVAHMKGSPDSGRMTTPTRRSQIRSEYPLPGPLVIPESPSVSRHFGSDALPGFSSPINAPSTESMHPPRLDLTRQSLFLHDHCGPRDRESGDSANDMVKSSQATEGEPLNSGPKNESPVLGDHDEPEFVSERSLRRRRPQPPPTTADPFRGSPADPIVVKEEPMDSQEGEDWRKRTLGRIETLDEETQFSPRKRAKFTSNPSSQLHYSSSMSIPDRACSMPAEESQRMVSKDHRPGSGPEFQPATLSRSQNDVLRSSGSEEDMLLDQYQTASTATNRIPPERVLNPLDPNALPRATIVSNKRGTERNSGRGSENRISYVTEDSTQTGQVNTPNQPNKVRSEGLLRHLLDPADESPKQMITPRRTPRAAQGSFKSVGDPATAPTTARKARSDQVANLPTPQSAPPQPRSTTSRARSKRKATTRLRDRPVSELKLEDFRVNPNLNEGVSYAFSEVVRGRARKCLPGCTDPACCGQDFRAMAENAGPEMFDMPKGFVSSQESVSAGDQERDDQGNFMVTIKDGQKTAIHPNDIRVLKNHFGNAFSFRLLSSMSTKGLWDAIYDARASFLAEKYGKHRQAFKRKPTPPLFWRTDMPSTQEFEQQREEAQAATAREVQERARIALRGGGRWVFRDEL